MNLPNRLTILRICMIPLFVVAYFLPFSWAPWVAVAIFVLAAFTDFLDGFIARKYHLVTDLGKLLDPIADKILVTAALFCVVATNPLQWMTNMAAFAGYSWNFTEFGSIFLTCCATLILGRELLIDAVRMIAASKGKVVQANVFGKIKTILQDVSLPLLVLLNVCGYYVEEYSLVSARFHQLDGWLVVGFIALILFGIATVMTVISGIIYLVQNRGVFDASPKSATDADTADANVKSDEIAPKN